MSRLKVLTFSTLYPSSVRPGHGIFVETRLRELLKSGAVESRVVAPVPWFPSTNPRWGDYARFAATPARDQRNGIEVRHPRYLLLPKVGMTSAPLTLALAARSAVRRLLDEGFDFDLIDAHYFFPDGVAAALLSKWFAKPLLITARGTDLNLIPQYAAPARMIDWAARRSAGNIGVCAALVDVLRERGHDPARLHVLRNGVDLERFRPMGRAWAREQLKLQGEGPILVSVGHLIERKGHDLVIEAAALLRERHPTLQLLVIGEGEEFGRLSRLIQDRGLASNVRLVGARPNEELKLWYSAADALVLASSREGWANVLLESMACDTPVVATKIWGTPEVVTPESGGVLVDRTAASLAAGLQQLLGAPPPAGRVRAYAEGFSWEQTSQGQLRLMRTVAGHGNEEATHA